MKERDGTHTLSSMNTSRLASKWLAPASAKVPFSAHRARRLVCVDFFSRTAAEKDRDPPTLIVAVERASPPRSLLNPLAMLSEPHQLGLFFPSWGPAQPHPSSKKASFGGAGGAGMAEGSTSSPLFVLSFLSQRLNRRERDPQDLRHLPPC